MPISQFADPTVAIQPPPLAQDFEDAQSVKDLDLSWLDDYSSTPAASSGGKSWTDVFQDAGRDFVRTFANAIGGKVAGDYLPRDPSLAAARAAREKADQQKLFWIVGGVGLAVVLGALVLRKGGKG